MMARIGYSATAVAVLVAAVTGCNDTPSCTSSIGDFKPIAVDAYRLPHVTLTSVQLARALEAIGPCVEYLSSDGATTPHAVYFIAAKRYKGRTLILVELGGVSDLTLVFATDADGQVVGKYKNQS